MIIERRSDGAMMEYEKYWRDKMNEYKMIVFKKGIENASIDDELKAKIISFINELWGGLSRRILRGQV